jgi:hypothetical protein
MHRISVLVFTWMALACQIWGGANAQAPKTAEATLAMPEILFFHEDGDDPVFVSPRRLFLPTGELDKDLFQRGYMIGFELMFNQEEESGCIQIDVSADHRDQPAYEWKTLSAALQRSDNVVVGRVTGRAFGFTVDNPGTLIRFAPMEVLKGLAPWDFRYVFFPSGDFSLPDGRRICAIHHQWPSSPQIGDALLIMYDDTWHNDRRELLNVRAFQLVTLPMKGSVSLPRNYRESDSAISNKTKADFLDEVRRELRAEAGQ